jgi:hypothetical protein
MTGAASLPRRLAFRLVTLAGRVLPPGRSVWAEAMKSELEHIDGDLEALKWAAGCVLTGYVERSNEFSFTAVAKKPSAVLPMAMSLAALAVVLVNLSTSGLVHQTDEGAAAHIWQLLMGGQMPILLLFAVKWLPRAPRQTVCLLVLQAGAALAALAPVYFLNL